MAGELDDAWSVSSAGDVEFVWMAVSRKMPRRISRMASSPTRQGCKLELGADNNVARSGSWGHRESPRWLRFGVCDDQRRCLWWCGADCGPGEESEKKGVAIGIWIFSPSSSSTPAESWFSLGFGWWLLSDDVEVEIE